MPDKHSNQPNPSHQKPDQARSQPGQNPGMPGKGPEGDDRANNRPDAEEGQGSTRRTNRDNTGDKGR
jgi:hypothetical protein